MKSIESLLAIKNASRGAYYLLMRILRQYTDLLDNFVYSEIISGANDPHSCVMRFVDEIGKAEAEVIIASLINAAAIDERISQENIEWAADIEDAFDEAATKQLRMRTTIHPKYLNAVAKAMREFER